MFGGAVLALLLSGCVSGRITDTSRTAVEQLLLSTAADRAVGLVDTSALEGKKVFVDVANLEATDKGYVVVAIRNELSTHGVDVVPDAKDAEVVVEAGSGALANDRSDFLFGIPSFNIPMPGVGVLQNPELAIFKKVSQRGRAKLLVYGREAKGGKPVMSSGPHPGSSYYKRWQILFVSWRTTDIPQL